jgi:hypothetical protein
MRDAPTPGRDRRQAPARSSSFDLAPKRAIAMRRCAEEVARGRVDLRAHDVRRLLAIRDIGRGRWRCSACTARAGWTSCPPATSGSSRSSAGS